MRDDSYNNEVISTDIAFKGGEARGAVSPPSSKSYTHRAIMMSALSGGKCTIYSPLLSFDTRSTMDAVRAMGAEVTESDGNIVVECGKFRAPVGSVDAGNSGTTLRLVTGLCSLFDTPVTLTGDASLRKRPMSPLLNALEGCGVQCESQNGYPPITVKGPIKGDVIDIDDGISSQFVSSLMMTAPLVGRKMTVRLHGKMVSRPYVDITIAMMKRFGVSVEEHDGCFVIEPQLYKPADYRIPSDFSSAAFPLVAGALSGEVTVEGMDLDDPQGDKAIIDVLRLVGCDVGTEDCRVTCKKASKLCGADIDMSKMPDLFPIVAVLLSTAEGTSRLYGAPHLRFKESDRIAITERMLRALGADITGTDDGCIINGVNHLTGGRIEHNGDHRILMAAAVASVIADGPVVMENDGCWNVSYPGFPEQMSALGIGWE